MSGSSPGVRFAQTSAASLQGTFSDPVGGNPLYSGQISEFLALGQGIGVQVGYFAQPGVSFDLRYSLLLPEFADNDASVVQRENVLAGGVTIYVHDPGPRFACDVIETEAAGMVGNGNEDGGSEGEQLHLRQARPG